MRWVSPELGISKAEISLSSLLYELLDVRTSQFWAKPPLCLWERGIFWTTRMTCFNQQVILIPILIIWKIIIVGRGWTIPCKSFIIIHPNMGGWLPLCSLVSSNHPVAQNDMFVPPRRTHEHRCVCVSQVNVDTVARSICSVQVRRPGWLYAVIFITCDLSPRRMSGAWRKLLLQP